MLQHAHDYWCSGTVVSVECVDDFVDRGNDNWLVKYEKPVTADSQPEVVVLHFQ